MTEKRWLTRKEAADYLGVHITMLDRYRFREGLPYSQVEGPRGAVRLDREEIDRWMKSHERTGAA